MFQTPLKMKFILAQKEEMSQVFAEDGRVVPVTVLSAGPCVVTQVKSVEKDGYSALQLGFGDRAEKNLSKAVKGHLKGKGNFRFLREERILDSETLSEGDTVTVSQFAEGDPVEVSGVSKGKGFQGVVKRHGFSGGPRTHGQKHSEREPGSIGGGLRTRVPKGMRMAGRMGGDRVTVKNLKVVKVDSENNKMYISGALPGRRGTLLLVRGA